MVFLHPVKNGSGQSDTETMFHFEVGEVYGGFFYDYHQVN